MKNGSLDMIAGIDKIERMHYSQNKVKVLEDHLGAFYYIVKILCSEDTMQRRYNTAKISCSEDTIQRRYYVMKILCSK